MAETPTTTHRALAKKVLHTEAAAIIALIDRLDERSIAVRLLLTARGGSRHTGMASRIICRKTPHAGQQARRHSSSSGRSHHGDLGVIQSNDVPLAILQRRNADTSPKHSAHRRADHRHYGNPADAAQSADVVPDFAVPEACPLNLPTASITAVLALGDALCMSLLVGGISVGGSLPRSILAKPGNS